MHVCIPRDAEAVTCLGSGFYDLFLVRADDLRSYKVATQTNLFASKYLMKDVYWNITEALSFVAHAIVVKVFAFPSQV